MMPEEWPIAAPAADPSAPARPAGRGRLSTVRADFFLDPAHRLTEQERALMSAMLHCLVGEVSDELRAILPPGWSAANDESNLELVEALTRARLLDDPELMRLLLRRADEERIGSAARVRSGRREARAIQGLVSNDDPAVSAAAMALILARGRRRDRFGQCLILFDDLSDAVAAGLVDAVAAGLRARLASAHGAAEADSALHAASARVRSARDPGKSVDSLTSALVHTLAGDEALDALILAAAHEGELAFVAEAAALRAGIAGTTAIDELLSGSAQRVMALLRMARFGRDLAAGLLAGVGDLLGLEDPGRAMAVFERMSDSDVTGAQAWLAATPTYRRTVAALEQQGG